ncbi:MAG: hexose kinase [FCB group bacterium]|nr:hexose kinase [FCB group bacterium]
MILSVCPNPAVDTYFYLDDLVPGKVNRLLKEQFYPGGKGVHVALAATELGENVQLAGFWGGATGALIKVECAKANIPCHGPQLKEWNRFCINIRSESQYSETEILGRGPVINKHDMGKFYKTLSGLMADAQCVTLSGSWPAGADRFAYAELIKLSHLHGCRTFLDCASDLLREALAFSPYCVHLNQHEATEAFGKGNPPQQVKLLAESCEIAVITVGEKGAYFSFENKFYHAECPVRAVYSSIGSGDCLLAGLAVAFIRKSSIREAIRLAVACGAANCMREELGMLYKHNVDELLDRVVINEINE